jgi:MFS transporter, putative metabolite:H+ symporter
MFKPPILQRLLVGSWVLITINTLIFGFVIFLPQFFLRLTITNSLGYMVVLAAASLVGCAFGARWSIIGASFLTIAAGWVYSHFNAASDPVIVLSVGAILIVAIYIQTAILFGVYTPELFPTEIRLRANGICNTLGPRRHSGVSVRRRLSDGQLSTAGRGVADDRPGRDSNYRGLLLGC